jgi:hypothetical protein
VFASNLKDLFYEIKYHYFSIDLPKASPTQRPLRITDKEQSSGRTGEGEFQSFRCLASGGQGNATTPLDILIDKSMVCDNEVDCVYGGMDEANCK